MYDEVKDYYGKQLQSSDDLKTSACCDASNVPDWIKPLLSNIHPDVLSRYYGCGLVCPPLLEGCKILDLGCGSGRDLYVLAQMVGKTGHVVGVDMTVEQLNIAKKYQQHHVDAFGFDNVTLIQGYIEKLNELDLEPNSFDIIVSNCVINLSPDKDAVLKGAYDLLKSGGEMYFSDVYSDCRIPSNIHDDPVLYGECLGGALYWNDFINIAKRQGFTDPRLVEDKPLEITNAELALKIGAIKFYSATYRLFKLDDLEADCEDYGQAVIYKGTIENCPHEIQLDTHHLIKTGKVFLVCGNTWRMLKDTRFAPHFDFIGDFNHHYGIFEGCGEGFPYDKMQSIKTNLEPSTCC